MKRSWLLALLLCADLIVPLVTAAEPLPTGKVDGIYYEMKGTGPAVVYERVVEGEKTFASR